MSDEQDPQPASPADPTPDDDRAQEAPAAEQDEQRDDSDELDPKVKAKLDKANREARSLRQRLKELEPLANRAKELEDAQKSEAQKLSDQLAAREVELAELRVEKVRTTAGQQAKLDPEFWEFITASDPEEALAQAKRLAARLTPPEPGRADLRQGARTPARQAPNPSDALRALLGHNQ